MAVRTPVAIPFPLRRAARPSLDGLGQRAGNAVFAVTAALALGAGILAVGPRFVPFQALPVLTGSMEPAIPTGSLAFVAPVHGDELAPGDVITFHHPNAPASYVTHRIVAIEGDGASRTFVTKGDANALADAWQVKGTGTGWRYAFALPVVGGIIVALSSSPARFALFAFPLIVLGLLALVEIWRPRPREVEPAVARAA